MLVVELLHNLHFTFDAFASVGLIQFGLLVDFDGNLLVQCTMQSKTNYSICSLPNSFANKVAVEIFN